MQNAQPQTNAARDAGQKKLTLTQSEELKTGQRAEYLPPNPGGFFAQRIARLGIKCWVEKRRKQPTEAEQSLRYLIGHPAGYELAYGITYNGKDYECGDIPRDLGGVVKGIEIGAGK